MDLDHEDGIDSRCGLCQREQRIGPETMAVDWVTRTNGHRLYVCREHAEPLARFGTALEDLPATPEADVCTGCGQLTWSEDMGGMRLCSSCGTDGRKEALRELSRMEATEGRLTFERAVDLLEDLVDEDEDVPPERAAEAIERWSGMPMTPAPEEDTTEEE